MSKLLNSYKEIENQTAILYQEGLGDWIDKTQDMRWTKAIESKDQMISNALELSDEKLIIENALKFKQFIRNQVDCFKKDNAKKIAELNLKQLELI